MKEFTTIDRPEYLNQLIDFESSDLVKVVTGIRRCGKSTLMLQYRDWLIAQGIRLENILYFNFESLSHAELRDFMALYRRVLELSTSLEGTIYLLFDEVQEVDQWERAINSFRVDLDCDITVTGSNAKLLSGELATLLSGRYVEIQMRPFSFAEFMTFRKNQGEALSLEEGLSQFMRWGGFPGVHDLQGGDRRKELYLTDIFNAVLFKDVINRNAVRDTELLTRILLFVMDNIGNPFSAKTISDYLKSQGRKLGVETVYNYLDWLENAFVVEKVKRFDIKGKAFLSTQEKIFFCDTGICNAILGERPQAIAGLLENMVYLNLRQKGFKVYIGKLGATEVDFVAVKNGQKHYIQVCYQLTPENTKREVEPLLAIKDSYPKTILTLSPLAQGTIEGIAVENLAAFLARDA